MGDVLLYIFVFLYGIIIGSFLNVCIYRIPTGNSIVFVPSHCSLCNKPIQWYDLIPVVSYILLKGKCRNCKTHISIQYPLIEILNGMVYLAIFRLNGWNFISVLYCLVISALIVLSVIDFRTHTINLGINIFIFLIAIIKLIYHISTTKDFSMIFYYIIGFCVVSSFLLILYFATAGKGIGMGDINLMAVAGLLLGWKLIILAFLLGCVIAAILHITMMKLFKYNRILAFGPYLSLGIVVAMLWGDRLILWYLNYMF